MNRKWAASVVVGVGLAFAYFYPTIKPLIWPACSLFFGSDCPSLEPVRGIVCPISDGAERIRLAGESPYLCGVREPRAAHGSDVSQKPHSWEVL